MMYFESVFCLSALSTVLGYLLGNLIYESFPLTLSSHNRMRLASKSNYFITSKKGVDQLVYSKVLDFPHYYWSKAIKEKKKERDYPSWVKIEKKLGRMKRENRGVQRIYVITPTVRTQAQVARLVATAQALHPIRHLVTWLIYEDSPKSQYNYPQHLDFLKEELQDFSKDGMDIRIHWSRIKEKGVKVFANPKGVEGRKDGIDWVRRNSGGNGILYFGDDDNVYSWELWGELLKVKNAGAWPVGLATKETRISTPLVNDKGKVVEIFDGFRINRKIPLDFAGFAVTAQLLIDVSKGIGRTLPKQTHPKAEIPYMAAYEESWFLRTLGLTDKVLEPLARNCTEIWAFHTKIGFTKYKKGDRAEILNKLQSLHGTNIMDILQHYQLLEPEEAKPTPKPIVKKVTTVPPKPKTKNMVNQESKVVGNKNSSSGMRINATNARIPKSNNISSSGITLKQKSKEEKLDKVKGNITRTETKRAPERNAQPQSKNTTTRAPPPHWIRTRITTIINKSITEKNYDDDEDTKTAKTPTSNSPQKAKTPTSNSPQTKPQKKVTKGKVTPTNIIKAGSRSKLQLQTYS